MSKYTVPDKLWNKLVALFGVSAATTYISLREGGCSRLYAHSIMLAQVARLGTDYPGGFDCVPFRYCRHLYTGGLTHD